VARAAKHDEYWRDFLSGKYQRQMQAGRRLLGAIPTDPRCKLCHVPFGGPGGFLARRAGFGPWEKNPTVCSMCYDDLKKHAGGVEIELTFLFADVRGSTPLAEEMPTPDYGRLISRFFSTASSIITSSDGAVEKFVGDEVAALYIPGFAGNDHARKAIDAARRIVKATSTWIAVGAGVHTGRAYVGTVGDEHGVLDMQALGDAPNVTARLASAAEAGVVLVSEPAVAAAGLDVSGLEARALTLKGKTERTRVFVLRAAGA
jgi:adenylate cyclase